MTTLKIDQTAAPILREIVVDQIRVYEILGRLLHTTEAERDGYKLRARVLRDVASQLPEAGL